MIRVPSLVGYWPMEGNANDASGNGRHGTVIGATLATGKFGKCYDFDGTDDYVSVPSDAGLNITGALTLAAWVNVDADATAQQMMGVAIKGGYSQYQLKLINSRVAATLYTAAGVRKDYYPSTGPTFALATWFHAAWAYDGADILRFYLNGVQSASIATGHGALATTAKAFEFGRATASYPFKGLIDELMIFSKALPESDIRRIMLGLHPLNG